MDNEYKQLINLFIIYINVNSIVCGAIRFACCRMWCNMICMWCHLIVMLRIQ